jgi:uncharacterized protein YegJ (DUF2314 family)
MEKVKPTHSSRFICRFLETFFFIVCAAFAMATDSKAEGQKTEFQFALYFAPQPKVDADEKLKSLLGENYAKALATTDKEGVVAIVTSKWLPLEDYKLPPADSFKYMTRDVPLAAHAQMKRSKQAFVLMFKAPRSSLLAANQHACELMADLADATAGIIWDEECRLFYTPATWRKKRVESWQNGIPDVTEQINMHAYRDPELVRVITLGMRKFGLPDLVVDSLPPSNTRPAGNAINACAQLLLEGNQPEQGVFDLDFSKIRHKQQRESALSNPGEGAKGKIQVRFSPTLPDEGDPDNGLLKLEFPTAKGTTYTEQQLDAYSQLFGATDKITGVKSGDQAMRAASEKARKAFFAKEAYYRKGLGPSEHLLVKTAFKIGAETEYMWVEVTQWNKDSVEGTLANDSYYDSSLKEGKRLTVKLSKVYDYMLQKPDGTTEGNETGKVLEALKK